MRRIVCRMRLKLVVPMMVLLHLGAASPLTAAQLPTRAPTAGATSTAVNAVGSVRIERLPWTEAERLLDTAAIVMIPLGAASKEHGPHLPLNNDWLLAEYFANRVAAATRVVQYPTVNYSFYPAFVEYPGSTSLRLETARDMLVDIIRGIARHGPRRFYVLTPASPHCDHSRPHEIHSPPAGLSWCTRTS